MSVNQAERAFKAWQILTKRAQEKSRITYGELGALINVHHRAIRYVLGLIQDHCLLNQLPPLSILVVNKGGVPGNGFIATERDKLKEGFDSVFAFNWSYIENPFAFAADGKRAEAIVSELVSNPSASGDVMRLVRSRGMAQAIFRDALLECYDGSCAFTGITFTEALEACHIIPWSSCTDEQRLDVRNGLLLNSLHHKLFDNRLITVDGDYKIQYMDMEMQLEPYTTFDRLISVDLHGKELRLPKNKRCWPELSNFSAGLAAREND